MLAKNDEKQQNINHKLNNKVVEYDKLKSIYDEYILKYDKL